MPFVTDNAAGVIALVNLSVVASAVANVVYTANDTRRLKAVGEATTAAISLAAVIAVWRVFPFAFDSDPFNWALLTRFVLILAIAGTAISIVVAVFALARATDTDAHRP